MTDATSSRSQLVCLDGCQLHLLREGAGAPLLFLHGASGGGEWLPFLADLAADHDVLAPDHPGFGRSSDPAWLDGVADLAYFYLDLLDTLDLRGVHLIGTSLGGWIAAEMAVRNTARLRSVTLVCAVGITAGGQPIPDPFRLAPDEHLARFCHDAAGQQARRHSLAALDPAVREKNRAVVTRLGYRPRFHNPDLAKWLHRIDVPSLVVWGASDGIVPEAFGRAYSSAIPGAEMVVIPEAGHAPFIEQPDRFTTALRGFFARLPG